MSNPGRPSATHGWDTYWQGTRDGDSYAAGGARHPAITSFWQMTLGELLASVRDDTRVLDIATGSGAVVESLFRQAGDKKLNITCVDISEAAIASVRERFPVVTGIVADARSIPLEASSYDLITSQFGIEYAGIEGIHEAARLVAAEGSLVLLVHCRPGAIYAECAMSLKVIDQLRQARFFPRAKALFKTGFSAVRNRDQRAYERAVHKFKPLIRLLVQTKLKYGESVASGLVLRLHNDLHQISQSLQKYDANEVFVWLDRLDREALSYRSRMKSMTDAALSQQQAEQMRLDLSGDGFSITEITPVLDDATNMQLAWSIQARRDAVRI